MKRNFFLLALFFTAVCSVQSGCGVYRFADVSIPATVKTIKIHTIENRAPYVNAQLSPNLSEKLRQKVSNQTRLTQTNGDNAHYDISGEIQEYSVSTSAIANKQEVTNRLTVRVKIIVNNQLDNVVKDFEVTRNWEFDANSSLQAAESRLLEVMIRTLTDDIFNRIFSNW